MRAGDVTAGLDPRRRPLGSTGSPSSTARGCSPRLLPAAAPRGCSPRLLPAAAHRQRLGHRRRGPRGVAAGQGPDPHPGRPRSPGTPRRRAGQDPAPAPDARDRSSGTRPPPDRPPILPTLLDRHDLPGALERAGRRLRRAHQPRPRPREPRQPRPGRRLPRPRRGQPRRAGPDRAPDPGQAPLAPPRTRRPNPTPRWTPTPRPRAAPPALDHPTTDAHAHRAASPVRRITPDRAGRRRPRRPDPRSCALAQSTAEAPDRRSESR